MMQILRPSALPSAVTPADPLAQTRHVLDAVERPLRLQICESSLIAARESRARIAGEHRAACGASEPGKHTAEARRLEDELVAADEQVKLARVALAAERAAWSPAFIAACAPLRSAAAEQALDAIAHLTTAVNVLRMVEDFAQRNGLDTPRALLPDFGAIEALARRFAGRAT